MKPVPRRDPEVFEADGRMEDKKPALGRAQDVGREPSGNLSFPYPLGFLVPERHGHTTMLLQRNSIVKQYYDGSGRGVANCRTGGYGCDSGAGGTGENGHGPESPRDPGGDPRPAQSLSLEGTASTTVERIGLL
jgi:hypothetical protein